MICAGSSDTENAILTERNESATAPVALPVSTRDAGAYVATSVLLLDSGMSDVTSTGPVAAETPSSVKVAVTVTYADSKSAPSLRSTERDANAVSCSGWYTRYDASAAVKPAAVTDTAAEDAAP